MSDEKIYTDEKLQTVLGALHARIACIEDERRAKSADSVFRSYRIAGILQGLALACLIYVVVQRVRGSNS